ncbi:MAG TPA: hypothetical protein VEK07_25490 [Polyangiaceae bacterium]|nr:hypothetical protein [Polyangiaceae bacterium]
MSNPLVTLHEAKGYLAAGDEMARVALVCADRARANWDRARELLEEAEAEFREVAERIEGDRDEFRQLMSEVSTAGTVAE